MQDANGPLRLASCLLLPAILLIVLAVPLLSGCGSDQVALPAVAPEIAGPLLPSLAEPPAEPRPAVELGRYAPDFTLTDLNGEAVSLSDWRGQVVLLNFWASWCAPCRQEMPLLQATYSAYADDGLVVLAVNMGEEKRRVENFAADLALTFPVLTDEEITAGTLYRVRGAPTTYFIDRDGVIRQRYVGPLSAEMLASILSGKRAFPNQ
ncbi:MAG: TlpA disulfide reductase family protein [Anaerolineae bacterium]|nr:TlpA disulfide reductase family protein [Anaerolineae bacterium]